MTAFFSWYFIISILGWLIFPLAYTLFPALADRGYTLSRAAGLLIWGYIFWLLASLGIAQNDLGGILLALAFIIGLCVWLIISHRSAIIDFLKSNISLILTTEILFFLAFAFLAFVRSANPELASTENDLKKQETLVPSGNFKYLAWINNKWELSIKEDNSYKKK